MVGATGSRDLSTNLTHNHSGSLTRLVKLSSGGEAMRVVFLILISVVLSGCATAELNEDTKFMANQATALSEDRILDNLGLMIIHPWSVPAHFTLASGQLMATHTAGFNFAVPFTHGLTGSSVTVGEDQFNLTPAQTADQAEYITTPVEDPDDQRRLRALYRYAICPDFQKLAAEWMTAAGQNKINSEVMADFPLGPSTPPVSKKALKSAEENADRTQKALEKVESALKEQKINPRVAQKSDALAKAQANANAASEVLKALKPRAKSHSANAAGKGQGAGSKDATVDTLENERRRLNDIVSTLGYNEPWLFWRQQDGVVGATCPWDPYRTATPTRYVVRVGTYNGVDLYANPDKLSNFMLLVNASVPNTIGTYVLKTDNTIIGPPPTRAGILFTTH